MIGRGDGKARAAWLQAIAISVALHGVGLASAIYRPSLIGFSGNNTPPAPPEIGVEAVIPEFTATTPTEGTDPTPTDPPPPEDPGLATIEDDTSTPPQLAASDGESPVLTPLAPETEAPSTEAAGQSLIVSTSMDLPRIALSALRPEVAPVAPEEGGTSLPPLPEAGAGGLDPRLAALVDQVRAELDLPCLIALPELGPDGLRLSVVGADDRAVAGLIERVGAELGEPVTGRPVLIDQRQCAALTFLRRTAQYPAYALPIQLQSGEIASGAELIGRIGNGAGSYNTLLLIDDNGVVQDLRRFLSVQGGEVSFDIPVTRAGAARDTSQLLVAVATPGRLQSVTRNAGKLAADFFPALAEELGENARIGVSSLYVR